MSHGGSIQKAVDRVRGIARRQDGFTMVVALGVLMVTVLLAGAAMLTVQTDVQLTRADLDGKRAYAAAQAGVQAYVYSLNASGNPGAWLQTCANDKSNGDGSAVAVPGSTTGVTYSYQPIVVNGYAACTTGTPASVIDNGTGMLRIEFTGKSGSESRTIVAGFETASPLKYLWYTVHETVDPAISGGDPTCANFYYSKTAPKSDCYIYWAISDKVRGPLYTQDQLLVSSSGSTPGPYFGRKNSQDATESLGPTVCASQSGGCPNAVFQGQGAVAPTTNHQDLPAANSLTTLAADASKYGTTVQGQATVVFKSDGSAVIVQCKTATDPCSAPSTSTLSASQLSSQPIMFGANDGQCNTAYSPSSVTVKTGTVTVNGVNYTYYYDGQACGDVYVSGTYSSSMTIAAANDVVVTGDVRTSEDTNGNPTGTATMGLFAEYYVRVYHPACNTTWGNPNVTIDAAIMALSNSFFVDDYGCGGANPAGTLTIHGAIAQYYRGIVGTSNNGVINNGYVKAYNYDNRLAVEVPPYLFGIENEQWSVVRETLCNPNVSSTLPSSCSYAS